MKNVRDPAGRLQALLDNQELDIKALEKRIAQLTRKLETANARNRDLRELLGRQASELVMKDRQIMLLRQQLQP